MAHNPKESFPPNDVPPRESEEWWKATLEKGEYAPQEKRHAMKLGESISTEGADFHICPTCEEQFKEEVEFKTSAQGEGMERIYTCHRGHEWVYDIEKRKVVRVSEEPE